MQKKVLEFKGVYIERFWNEDHWSYKILPLQGLHQFGLSSIKEISEEMPGFFYADITYNIEKKSYTIDSKRVNEKPTIMEICVAGSAVGTLLRSQGYYQAVKTNTIPGEFIFNEIY